MARRAKLTYTPQYTDLDKAIRELGTAWMLRTINAALHRAGMQRKRNQDRDDRRRPAPLDRDA